MLLIYLGMAHWIESQEEISSPKFRDKQPLSSKVSLSKASCFELGGTYCLGNENKTGTTRMSISAPAATKVCRNVIRENKIPTSIFYAGHRKTNGVKSVNANAKPVSNQIQDLKTHGKSSTNGKKIPATRCIDCHKKECLCLPSNQVTLKKTKSRRRPMRHATYVSELDKRIKDKFKNNGTGSKLNSKTDKKGKILNSGNCISAPFSSDLSKETYSVAHLEKLPKERKTLRKDAHCPLHLPSGNKAKSASTNVKQDCSKSIYASRRLFRSGNQISHSIPVNSKVPLSKNSRTNRTQSSSIPVSLSSSADCKHVTKRIQSAPVLRRTPATLKNNNTRVHSPANKSMINNSTQRKTSQRRNRQKGSYNISRSCSKSLKRVNVTSMVPRGQRQRAKFPSEVKRGAEVASSDIILSNDGVDEEKLAAYYFDLFKNEFPDIVAETKLTKEELITFFNPMVNRKPKLQRQKQLFPKAKGKHFLRAGEMHTNIATWARLLKRAAPPNSNSTYSPNNITTKTLSTSEPALASPPLRLPSASTEEISITNPNHTSYEDLNSRIASDSETLRASNSHGLPSEDLKPLDTTPKKTDILSVPHKTENGTAISDKSNSLNLMSESREPTIEQPVSSQSKSVNIRLENSVGTNSLFQSNSPELHAQGRSSGRRSAGRSPPFTRR